MRWVCMKCLKQNNAPSKMRLDDLRRFCLPCSKKTGRLERKILVIRQKRQAAKAERRAAEKEAAKVGAELSKLFKEGR